MSSYENDSLRKGIKHTRKHKITERRKLNLKPINVRARSRNKKNNNGSYFAVSPLSLHCRHHYHRRVRLLLFFHFYGVLFIIMSLRRYRNKNVYVKYKILTANIAYEISFEHAASIATWWDGKENEHKNKYVKENWLYNTCTALYVTIYTK